MKLVTALIFSTLWNMCPATEAILVHVYRAVKTLGRSLEPMSKHSRRNWSTSRPGSVDFTDFTSHNGEAYFVWSQGTEIRNGSSREADTNSA